MEEGGAPLAVAARWRAVEAYAVVLLAGATIVVAVEHAGWRALGVGLWFPGAGFLSDGGWWWLLLPATLALLLPAIFVWFHEGMAAVPMLVWLAAAVGAGLAAGRSISIAGTWTAAGIVVAAAATATGVALERRRRSARLALARQARLPYRLKLASTTAAAAQRDRPAPRELDQQTLDGLRFVLDRALQPVGRYSGYERSRTWAAGGLPEQILAFGYALALMQSHYTPNFHGYATEAQRRLVETFLRPPVVRPSRRRTLVAGAVDADPLGTARLDVAGAYALYVALYTAATGDGRYLRLNALGVRDGATVTHPHDLRELAATIDRAFAESPTGFVRGMADRFDLGANLRALAALQVLDRMEGTSVAERHLHRLDAVIRTEFHRRDLDVVAARSMHLGIALPAHRPGIAPATLLAPAFPELAARAWAVLREEQFRDHDGELVAVPPSAARLEREHAQEIGYEGLFRSAREHGDHEAADAAQRALDALHAPGTETVDGAHGSHVLTACALYDRMAFRAAWRGLVRLPTPQPALDGPLLDTESYPAVLVAAAQSTGTDLDLVLYPGAGPGLRELHLARLNPGRRYRAHTPAGAREFVAAADGRAVVDTPLEGRTQVRVEPS